MRRWIAIGLFTLGAALLPSCSLVQGGPRAQFDVRPVVVYAGETIELDARATSGPALIVSYSWDLGHEGATAAGDVVTTVYPEPGSYRVRLTVRDANGRSAVAEQQITVYLQSGTTLLQEGFSDGMTALARWPLDPTWAAAEDATIDQVAGDPGYALFVHSGKASWHRRYTAVRIPPLRVGQSVVFSCSIMAVQSQDEHSFLFAPGRHSLEELAGSLPYYVFTAEGHGSYVHEPTPSGRIVARPIPFTPEIYRWHTYTFSFHPATYELHIDGVEIHSGQHAASFAETEDWILVVGEESFTEACRAYYDDIRVSVEE